ncbi:type IX secretion system plug protein domain-containing protein [uncultured Algibacter sp.]|uniref:type IX secretion system plug protein n=1 Tax=uncultured Algibacter sp. TaxID=298659 RepID=UPI0025EA6869|nr:type IX secretion system plug protein domain-containing protein [uncultured Algibacter sp.]
MSLKFPLIWLCFIATGLIYGQVEEVNPPDYIKSITFKSNSSDLGELPIIKLGEPFYLEFDALVSDEPDFYYKIEHYDYDWKESVLVKPEFLLGVDNFRIQDYTNSFNTFQMYSHYKLSLPNRQTKQLKVSGNYIISIYDTDNELVFSRKFMIYENLVTPGIAIKRSRDVSNIETTQTVDIEIVSGPQINNPLQTVKTLIIQNSNLNTTISNLKPQYTIGNKLIYRYIKETAFAGGNEYLFLETKDVRAATSRVQSIALENIYQSYLYTDVTRKNLPYTYNPDINGQFKIVAIDRDDVAVEADYVQVHFSLQYPELTNGESIYIYGNYNNYALSDYNKMTLNIESGLYETNFKLKQGFYNYKYVIVNKNGDLNEGAISGDFWQTENNYKVLVYYRDLGARYDRIIGFNQVSSTNISN